MDRGRSRLGVCSIRSQSRRGSMPDQPFLCLAMSNANWPCCFQFASSNSPSLDSLSRVFLGRPRKLLGKCPSSARSLVIILERVQGKSSKSRVESAALAPFRIAISPQRVKLPSLATMGNLRYQPQPQSAKRFTTPPESLLLDCPWVMRTVILPAPDPDRHASLHTLPGPRSSG